VQFYEELTNLAQEAQHIPDLKQHLFKILPNEILENPKWVKHITPHMRGRGYWFWKAAIPNLLIKNGTISDGDVIVWLDADAWGNLPDFYRAAYKGLVAEDNDFVTVRGGFCERDFTKGDIFHRFGVTSDHPHYGWGEQVWASRWAVKVNERIRKLFQMWEDLMVDFHLVSDEPSVIPNAPGFSDNRHDQSFLGMLIKASTPKHGHCHSQKLPPFKWERHKEFGIDGLKVKIDTW